MDEKRLHPMCSSAREGRGVHLPEAMMHFPPVSDFPPISVKLFRLRGQFSLFSKLFPIFIRENV